MSRTTRRWSLVVGILLLAGSAGSAQDWPEFIIPNEGTPGANFATAVNAAGDVNGDGIDDIIVGAPFGASLAGEAFVLAGPAPGTAIYSGTGQQPGDRFGNAVSGLGDVNGDNMDEFIISSNLAGVGLVQVFDGLTQLPLTTLPGSGSGDNFGFSLAPLGDVNSDMIPDFAVGIPGQDAVNVYSGTGALIGSLTGPANSSFGHAIASAGDINGDGINDLIVGEPDFDVNRGRARVFSGQPPAFAALPNLSFSGDGAGDRFGRAVAGGQDHNGDGTPDLIVGAPFGPPSDTGYVRVVSGASGTTIQAIIGPMAGSEFGSSVAGTDDLDIDGCDDFVVGAPTNLQSTEVGCVTVFSGGVLASPIILCSTQAQSPNTGLGTVVASAGDFDNDETYNEILVGEPKFVTSGGGGDGSGGDDGQARVVNRSFLTYPAYEQGVTPPDVSLSSGIDVTVMDPVTPFPDIKLAQPGSVLTIDMASPMGTYGGLFPILVAQVFATSGGPPGATNFGPPLNPTMVHVDPASALIVINGPGVPGFPLILGAGLTLNFAVDVAFAGFSALFQMIIVDLNLGMSPFFVATDGQEIRVQ